ncbi:FecR family protein [Janthinobacterium aquaticum]|uniref:FecR family protein n=1 Tax=Janthinobacterium sp. FT58W TaxID=2654254 RepID=UPI001D0208DA|nr:FecR family protein [Janthinobacterium sp. FT58W]
MAYKKPTAIKAILAQACLWLALMGVSWHAAAAQLAGTVMQLSGPMMAKKADGKIKVLAIKSEVEEGDTLMTEKSTYALVKFIDNSEMTLKPGTTFVIEKFAYQAEQAAGDQASFNLVKGGLRSISGLLGKRSKEKFSLKTPAATIGIRGTNFVAEMVPPPNAANTANGPDVRPGGLYTAVSEGGIEMVNPAGKATVDAGQFGFAPSFVRPPVKLPTDPGMQFTPSPSFNSMTAPQGTEPTKDLNTVDCEVR